MKKRKSTTKKQIQRIKVRRSASNAKKMRHPILKPGMLLRFRKNPAESLTEDEWIFDPGIQLWDGKITETQLEQFFMKNRTSEAINAYCQYAHDVYEDGLYTTFAFLVKVIKITQGYFFQVLIGDKLWWVHQSDFSKV